MSRSNYVLAGFETLITYDENLRLRNKQGNWDNHYSPKKYANLLSENCYGFLHSFGQNFARRKKYKGYKEKEAEIYTLARQSGLFDKNTRLFIDSGGFQIGSGILNDKEAEILIDLYHEFLIEYVDLYDRAFILDLPPGPDCLVFKDFKDVYEANNRTYNIAKELPENVRDKVIFIQHFRTPKLWDIHTDILDQKGMFESFKHFGTGGIVANMSGDNMPYIIYILPLIPLLNRAIKDNRKELNFHVLGGASYRDIFFYEIFQQLVEQEHNIKLNITFDSSGAFKGVMRGRTINLLHNDNVRKLDLRSKTMRIRNYETKDGQHFRPIDIMRDKLHGLADRYDFKRLDLTEIYDERVNSFSDVTRSYIVLLTLLEYADVQQWLRQKAKNIYPLYRDGNLDEFAIESSKVTQSINRGKITRKQKHKTNSLINSLKLLSSLDETHCRYIVDKFLAKDEFVNLDKTKKVLTF